jgi:hypothetical protein
VENETTILPILIETKNMKSSTIIKRCNRNEPILTDSMRYEIVFFVNTKRPAAKRIYTIEIPVLLSKLAKVTGEFIFKKRMILYLIIWSSKFI